MPRPKKDKKKVKKKVANPKPGRVSNRTVSFREFKKFQNNFRLIFDRRPGNTYRKSLSSKGFSFKRLESELPGPVSVLKRLFAQRFAYERALASEYGFRKVTHGHLFLLLLSLPKEKKKKALSRFSHIKEEFSAASSRPLYELYLFLKKKGFSHEELYMNWWNIKPKPRK